MTSSSNALLGSPAADAGEMLKGARLGIGHDLQQTEAQGRYIAHQIEQPLAGENGEGAGSKRFEAMRHGAGAGQAEHDARHGEVENLAAAIFQDLVAEGPAIEQQIDIPAIIPLIIKRFAGLQSAEGRARSIYTQHVLRREAEGEQGRQCLKGCRHDVEARICILSFCEADGCRH